MNNTPFSRPTTLLPPTNPQITIGDIIQIRMHLDSATIKTTDLQDTITHLDSLILNFAKGLSSSSPTQGPTS